MTPDGKYKSAYSSSRERQSVSLGSLSAGRIGENDLRDQVLKRLAGIVGKGANACRLAATIAIRYSCARHQFGEKPGSESRKNK